MATQLAPISVYGDPGVRAVVQDTDGRILLLKRPDGDGLYPGTWNLPGGAKEDNESFEQGAARELLEETGLSAQPAGRETTFYFPGNCGMAYLYKEPSGELRPAAREVAAAEWFAPDALPAPLFPQTREILEGLGLVPRPEARVEVRADGVEVLRDVFHLDREPFKAPVKTPEGYLKAEAFAGRTGVLVYLTKEGNVRRELVPPDELFAPASLATLAEQPVTREHPPELLDATNAPAHTKGWTGPSVTREGDFVRVGVKVTDGALVEEIVRGERRETSSGYRCDLVMQPGTWNGQEYDAVQTNRRYNHLAIVRAGRAGHEVRIRMDAAERIPHHDHKEDLPMETTVTIAGVNHPASPALAAAVASLLTQQRTDGETIDSLKKQKQEAMDKAAGLQKKIDEMESENTDTKAAFDKEKARADAADAALEKAKGERMDAATIEKLVADRVALVAKVAAIVPADVKLDGLTVRELQVETIKAVFPKLGSTLAERTDDAIATIFDTALAEAPNRVDASRQIADAARQARKDAADQGGDKVEVARDKNRKDSQEAWKQPIGTHK